MYPSIETVLATGLHTCDRLPPDYWTLLLRQARRHGVLPQLARILRESKINAPAAVMRHLVSANRLAERHIRDVHREAREIARVLRPISTPIVFLKGSAYALQDLDAAGGRIYGDIDILVERAHLRDAENLLIKSGWSTASHDDYDQRYYRDWMHEVPPLKHIRRGTTIDLHHTLTPPTSRFPVNAAAVLERLSPIADLEGCFTLNPSDMIIHSAVHRYMEGEWENGYRDLLDIHRLCAQFITSERDWRDLQQRADALGLRKALQTILQLTSELFGTNINPMDVAAQSIASRAAKAAMLNACEIGHPDEQRSTAAARAFLYVRSHWLRMPPLLLSRHLARKAWIQISNPFTG